jgi:plasmid stability protein
MPNILIRNIEKETLDRLKDQAKNNNRSLQEELKELLEMYSGVKQDRAIEMVQELQRKYKATGKEFPDSSEEISKDRQR